MTGVQTCALPIFVSSTEDFRGAGDRTRTGTLLPAVDFESTTSTNSITPAENITFDIISYSTLKSKSKFQMLQGGKPQSNFTILRRLNAVAERRQCSVALPNPLFRIRPNCDMLSGERSCLRSISALAEARRKIPALHYFGVVPQMRMYSILGISIFFYCVLKYSLPSVRNPGNLSQNSNILFRRCLGYSWCISKYS